MLNTAGTLGGEAYAIHLELGGPPLFLRRLIQVHMQVQMNVALLLLSRLPRLSSHLYPSLHACLQGCSQDMLLKVPHSDEAESSEGPFDYVLCLRKRLLVWSCRWAPVVCWSSTWTQDSSVLGSNPCSSTAGGVTLILTCIQPLCASPLTLLWQVLTLGCCVVERNANSQPIALSMC